jgi:transposase-like protein
MGQPKRRHFTADQKSEILRRHLADKVPVSDLCDEYGIQPSLFYNWQRQLRVATRNGSKPLKQSWPSRMLSSLKFYRCCDRYGRVNQHNRWLPRDHWITRWEKEAIVKYHDAHSLEG